MKRRNFLTAAAATLGAGWLSRAQGAATPSPAPEPNALSQGGLVYDFGADRAQDFPGGSVREQTAANFPASPTISAALLDLRPGGVRGFHWHKGAAEYGAVLSGTLLLVVVDDQNRQEIGLVEAGDVYYVPRAFGHALAAVGDTPCQVLAVYDDGVSVETNALNLSDWVAGERPSVLATILGQPGDELRRAAAGVPLIAAGPPLAREALGPRGLILPPPESFRFRMTKMAPQTYPGGSFVQASVDQFPNSRTMIGAFTLLTPGGVREPHWHPNADEWDFVLRGRARITLFDGGRKSGEVEVGPNQVGFLPRGQAHAVETIGDEDFYLFSIFNANEFQAIGLTPALLTLPDPLLATNLGLPAATAAKLPTQPRFIYR